MSFLSFFKKDKKKTDDRRILPAGDCALVVEFGDKISEELNGKVQALNEALKGMKLQGVVETVPTFRSLLVVYDPELLSFGELRDRLERIPVDAGGGSGRAPRIVEIPVCYGGEFGEDLPDVAKYHGLSEEEVISLHSGRDYPIYMLGFLPGFPYLGGLDERLCTPRLSSPRTRIPAGSIGIGGEQTGIYPLDSPGGWRLIGRTPLRLYDPDREEPVPYRAGDVIRFVPITREEYEAYES